MDLLGFSTEFPQTLRKTDNCHLTFGISPKSGDCDPSSLKIFFGYTLFRITFLGFNDPCAIVLVIMCLRKGRLVLFIMESYQVLVSFNEPYNFPVKVLRT